MLIICGVYMPVVGKKVTSMRSEKALWDDLTVKQKESLDTIRKGVIDIWEGIEVVRGFTGHGVDHSERMLEKAKIILSSRIHADTKLNSNERYLIEAGIYLHDIGMQCYPHMHFDDIKARAEKLAKDKGVKFEDVNFTTEGAQHLTEEEQTFIRKNHGFLTAAWIEHLYNCNDYDCVGKKIGLACKSIPPKLVTDLMDICMYHTKLHIERCPEKFTQRGYSGNKQLVAAILRLSDELDIGEERIKGSVIDNFKMDPANLTFWLMNKYTELTIDNNKICLTVTINDKDAERYGHIFKAKIINEFCRKNKMVFKILNKQYQIEPEKKSDDESCMSVVVGNEKIVNGLDTYKGVVEELKKLETEEIVKICRYKYNIKPFLKRFENDFVRNQDRYDILVIGDIMLDHWIDVSEAGYSEVATHNMQHSSVNMSIKNDGKHKTRIKNSNNLCELKSPGGAGGIVTSLLKIPLVHVKLLYIVGNDMEGDEVNRQFAKLQEECKIKYKNDSKKFSYYPVTIKDYPTVTKNYFNIYYNIQGQKGNTLHRYDRENSKFLYKKWDDYKDQVMSELGKVMSDMKSEDKTFDSVLLKDHQKGLINKDMISWVREHCNNAKIFVDPKYDWGLFEELKIDAIIPNIKEAAKGLQKRSANLNIDEDEILEMETNSMLNDKYYQYLFDRLNHCGNYIVKADKNGAVIVNQEGGEMTVSKIAEFKIREEEVVTDIGCGNVFDSYYILSQLKGYSVYDSVKVANLAASVNRKSPLGEVPSPGEIYSGIEEFHDGCPLKRNY